MAVSGCRLGTGAGVRHVFWLVLHQGARLALEADDVGDDVGRLRDPFGPCLSTRRVACFGERDGPHVRPRAPRRSRLKSV
jgi:hypothetical protein